MTSLTSFTAYLGLAGDRNTRGMAGAALMAEALARSTGLEPVQVGVPAAPLAARWDAELDAAQATLRTLADRYDVLLRRGLRPLTAMGRCATALATLPVVARHRPNACIVWFDAHADANTPDTSTSGYLGGLVLTGASGRWPSPLGSGLRLEQVVLVGSRDIDPPERCLIDQGALRLVPAGAGLAERLRAAIGQAPVYVHLDCDVLEPGIVPTEYRVPDGLTLQQLHQAAQVLAEREVIGLEIAEFESAWAEDGTPGDPAPVIEALQPLLKAVTGS
jgi:arginase